MSYRSLFSGARLVLLAAILAVFMPTTTFAQTDGTRAQVPHEQVISVNPFSLMFKWFNAEYERKLTSSTTWGLSGSFLSLGSDVDYVNANALFRFYPQGASLNGVFLGGRTGVYRVSTLDEHGTFFGAGLEVGYNWLLGTNRNIDLSIGFGVNRLFGRHLDDVSLVVPSVRLINVGVAF